MQKELKSKYIVNDKIIEISFPDENDRESFLFNKVMSIIAKKKYSYDHIIGDLKKFAYISNLDYKSQSRNWISIEILNYEIFVEFIKKNSSNCGDHMNFRIYKNPSLLSNEDPKFIGGESTYY